jgi:hypothetical protein
MMLAIVKSRITNEFNLSDLTLRSIMTATAPDFLLRIPKEVPRRAGGGGVRAHGA